MIPLKVAELVSITGGELVSGSPKQVIKSVSTDTRTLKRGDFFVPLKGEHFDGHDFMLKALQQGASGFFTEKWGKEIKSSLARNLPEETAVIKVKDSLKTLPDIAGYIRVGLDIPVVGITGSVGKTCTKDILKSLLKQELKVVSSPKNYNNEIGLPLTILKTAKETEVLVLELAMRGKGEIKELARIAQPTIGVVTNIGEAHFEFLGSKETIFEAKAELIRSLPPEGAAILNEDDPWSKKLKAEAPCKVVTFGLAASADITASKIRMDSLGKTFFRLNTQGDSLSVSLPFPAKHQVLNALAATAVALELKISLSSIKRGLKNSSLSEMRMQVIFSPDGIVILNDAYNANPASVKAALLSLKEVSSARKIAVLGDMLELGKLSEVSHFEIGKFVVKSKVDFLITVGQKSLGIAQGALQQGMPPESIYSCRSPQEAGTVLKREAKSKDAILVKASRAMKLEECLTHLVK